IVSALMFYSTYNLFNKFHYLTDTSEQQIKLRKAAREFLDASDFLTESVQRFTINGNMRFLNDYFREAFDQKHREEAINIMSAEKGDCAAFKSLQAAMDSSTELMMREYYAMMLVINAKGYTDYPEILKSVVLSDSDKALNQLGKMYLAIAMVHDDVYFHKKEEIRKNIRVTLDELERMAYDTDATELSSIRNEINVVRLIIVLQIFGIFLMVWLTSRLGVNPILKAVEHIKAKNPIPEVGANEFRYLARAYNKMYEVYKTSLEHLNFKASHDELTGAYNRFGYELLLSSIDLKSTYMLLFDLDNFKQVNDTYGHETGDKILVKLVKVLNNNFRSDDYICRIGGDEFIVFMIHTAENQKNLINSKMLQINKELQNTSDGLPPITASIGAVHGLEVENSENLFEATDEAMYKSKHSGKGTHMFYSRK
ncbi:MAG: diguanylate cyclase, partial [Synergistaceae bacterium]|nr:diguanylate cyclase [Synergistaceae bacterium]